MLAPGRRTRQPIPFARQRPETAPHRSTVGHTAGGGAHCPPENKLSDLEQHRVLDVLNCERFVDRAPLKVFAQPLDEGTYLCSVSTMYRVVRENAQVAERRRLARHPAKACPELVATAASQVYPWDITKLAGSVERSTLRCVSCLEPKLYLTLVRDRISTGLDAAAQAISSSNHRVPRAIGQ